MYLLAAHVALIVACPWETYAALQLVIDVRIEIGACRPLRVAHPIAETGARSLL